MGLFGKKDRSSRVAEGGGGALAAASPAAAPPPKGNTGSLELFGADSDESDDEATIDRYAKEGDESLDEEEAAEAEKRKVAVLNAKVRNAAVVCDKKGWGAEAAFCEAVAGGAVQEVRHRRVGQYICARVLGHGAAQVRGLETY
jgi:hypothetical protein